MDEERKERIRELNKIVKRWGDAPDNGMWMCVPWLTKEKFEETYQGKFRKVWVACGNKVYGADYDGHFYCDRESGIEFKEPEFMMLRDIKPESP